MRFARWAVWAAVLAIFAALSASGPVQAQAVPRAAPTTVITVDKLPPPVTKADFNAGKATEAYLNKVDGAARARADAYSEGGHWLLLIDTLYAIAVGAILLWSRISARMRDVAQSITRSRFWQVPIYVVQVVVLTAVLGFPLPLYQGFFRAHAYGLSNQNFAQWLGDFAIAFAAMLVAAVVLLTLLYGVMRASRRLWWLWGTLVSVAFLAFAMLIQPVAIAPLFNRYAPLPASPLKSAILSLAKANGVPASDITEFDASRQTGRISTKVSGLSGTTRIALSDNLVAHGNPREILAVTAQQMGHYLFDHNAVLLTWVGLLLLVGFVFVDWGFRAFTDVFGGNWDVRTIEDPAGLPLMVALFSLFLLLTTPIQNTVLRRLEAQADIFGLNAARQPDGFATVTLTRARSEKLDPGPWEEFLFYDHPSAKSRIQMAMQWKAEHLKDGDIASGTISPQ